MALPPIIASPMASIVIALMKTQSDSSNPSAIELAERTHTRLLTVYVVWLVIAAIVTAFLTWAVWKAGNKQQEAVITEASGRTAKLEIAANDSKAAQQRVEIQLAEALTAQASAEKSLLELQERFAPRLIKPEQRKRFIDFMATRKKGKVSLKYVASDNNEPKQFALLLGSLLTASGCEVISPMHTFIATGAPMTGIELKVKNKDAPPIHAGYLQKAFEHIEISAPASLENPNDNSISDDEAVIYVYGKN
jgi:hypothetical protein